MKLTRFAVSGALTAALLLGGAIAPMAHAQETTSAERYVVTLADSAAKGKKGKIFGSAADSLVKGMKAKGIAVEEVYPSVGAVVADMTAAQAKALKSNSSVAAVEKDSKIYGTQVEGTATQTNAPWHLDRVDQKAFNYNTRDGKYTYLNTGSGVTAYVVDSGVDPNSPDIVGRVDVAAGRDFVQDGNGPKGCHPHGTQVATTLAGSKYGVAKSTKIVSIRVLDCDNGGWISDIIAAMDHIVSVAKMPSVVNMSLGTRGTPVESVDAGVKRITEAGIPVVVSAGNEASNACNTSPARAPQAITVASTNTGDYVASFSNYGNCVDLFAPGTAIQTDDSSDTVQGTSFSAPIVSGAVAQLLQVHKTVSPETVKMVVLLTASDDVVKNAGTSPNRLVNAYTMSSLRGLPDPKPVYPGWKMDHAGEKIIGHVSNVWGTLPAGATTAWTEVWTGSAWSRSQIRTANANGFVVIPLSYGMDKVATYRYRVATEVGGKTVYTAEFDFDRTPLYVGHAGVKKINQVTNMWGAVPTAANRRVETQVYLNGRWSTSQVRTADGNGYVVIPLTYGSNVPGYYNFRAVYYTPYGKIISEPFRLQRIA